LLLEALLLLPSLSLSFNKRLRVLVKELITILDSSIEYDDSILAIVILKTRCDDVSNNDDVIPFNDCIILSWIGSGGSTVGIDGIVGDDDGFGDGIDVGCDDGCDVGFVGNDDGCDDGSSDGCDDG